METKREKLVPATRRIFFGGKCFVEAHRPLSGARSAAVPSRNAHDAGPSALRPPPPLPPVTLPRGGAGPVIASRLENLIKLTHGCKLSRYRQGCQVGPVARRRAWMEGRCGGERGRRRRRRQSANGRGCGARRSGSRAGVWYSNTFRVVVAVSTVKLAFTVPPGPLNVADHSVAAAAVSNKTRSP